MNNFFEVFKSITLIDIGAFLIPFILAIFIDIKMHKDGETVSMKNAAGWSVVWFICASLFSLYIYNTRGIEDTGLYFTGLILEKSLAIDNLFAFYLIFKSFGLTLPHTQHFQHKILYFGILGAILFRVIFLGAGAFFVNMSPAVLLVFAAIVLFTVYKMWGSSDSDEEIDYTQHWASRIGRKFFKVNPSIESHKFFSNGATPLFFCLLTIEACDIVFAFDSVPVVVGFIKDPYLMITSSLWAAAGLRSLYFLLIAAQNKLHLLDRAIMILLVFVSFKLIGNALGFHLNNLVSLGIVTFILSTGVIMSLLIKNPEKE